MSNSISDSVKELCSKYRDTLKALHLCADAGIDDNCTKCPYFNQNDCVTKTLKEAGGFISCLLIGLAEYELLFRCYEKLAEKSKFEDFAKFEAELKKNQPPKEMPPKIMLCSEVANIKDEAQDIIFETNNNGSVLRLYAHRVPEYDTDKMLALRITGRNGISLFDVESYYITWRCWDKMPTKKQAEEHPFG